MNEGPETNSNNGGSFEFRVSKKVLAISGMGLVLLLVLVSGGLYLQSSSKQKGLPKEVVAHISGFQPYYFSSDQKLPNGLAIDTEQTRYEQGTLFLTIKSADGKTINVSQQPVPEEFSAKAGSFIGKDSFDTPVGKASLSYIDGRTSAFLITKDKQTLIILNSNQAVSTDTLRIILSSLSKN
ncbi:MAG: hypothetical protein AAB436_04650 [Patescibacteria group bacterium]